jgi:ABC-2 type transport system ATP-binding protein
MNVSADPVIEISKVCKSFGKIPAVAGVDLTVSAGEVVALLGPNGAGKTTMLDILLGLQRPDSGSVRVLGGPVQAAIWAGRIGAVLQEGEPLREVTVHELISTMSDLQSRPMPLPEVIQRAELGDLLGRRTEKLSGGEIQRLRFALSLVGDPELLVLDEPTAAMDIAARRSFWGAVRDLAASGRTILFSTHYLEEADAWADRIVLLSAGRVVADGPASQIRSVAAARIVRCTLPDADPGWLASMLPGVSGIEIHGGTVTIRSTDSDGVLRTLLPACPLARDIEVTVAPLADAVLQLTGEAAAHGMEPVAGGTRS